MQDVVSLFKHHNCGGSHCTAYVKLTKTFRHDDCSIGFVEVVVTNLNKERRMIFQKGEIVPDCSKSCDVVVGYPR